MTGRLSTSTITPGRWAPERLLVAELIARGLEGFVKNSVRTPRITEELCLPAFEHSAHQPYAWPRSR
jgi:hypothetical protein